MKSISPTLASTDAPSRALTVGEPFSLVDQGLVEPIFRVFAAVPADPRLPAKSIAMTVARGLAAQIDGRILLVDARLDPPLPAATSDTAGERGLSEALIDGGGWQEGQAVVVEPGLFFLPRGNAPAPSPAQVRTRVAALLSEFSSYYAVVVLLCDPVTESVMARSIASLCEKALIFVREDSTLMDELIRSREILISSLVAQVEIVLEKPDITWKMRILGPPYQMLAGIGGALAKANPLKRRLVRGKPEQEKQAQPSWPQRPPIHEPNEG